MKIEIEITKDCLCEHYIYEIMNYPRPELDMLKKYFKVGERYKVDTKWNNVYGEYYRVKSEGLYHDVSTSNCKVVQ